MRITVPVLLFACLALVAAGCSEEQTKDIEKKDTAADSGGGAKAETTAPPETSGELRSKPKITVPKGAAPKQLQVQDLVQGKGAVAKSGSQLSVNYVGVSYSNGQEFDSSFGKQPLQFQLGAGNVIPGWDRGLEGMKVGGRRQLTIPPDLAYGPQGQGPIGPNETLLFVIDLLGVQ